MSPLKRLHVVNLHVRIKLCINMRHDVSILILLRILSSHHDLTLKTAEW